WHFAEPVGEGISNAGSLLPGWHRPHLADTAAARAVVYSTVIPNLLRIVGVVKVEMQGCASNARDVRLRGGIINGWLGVRAGLRIVAAIPAQVAPGRQDGLSLRGGGLEEDIFLLDLTCQTRALFAEDPACTDHRHMIIDDTRPGIVVRWQRV